MAAVSDMPVMARQKVAVGGLDCLIKLSVKPGPAQPDPATLLQPHAPLLHQCRIYDSNPDQHARG